MLRGHFGVYFLGQLATFIYLVQSMSHATQFQIADWPQFSIYNLVVANFWPFYWVVYFVDSAKLDRAYWHVYEVAQARAAEIGYVYQMVAG